MNTENNTQRFTWLLLAIGLLLIGYPYFQDTATGAFVGGMVSLLLCFTGVYAVHQERFKFISSGILALNAATAITVIDLIQGTRSHPYVEISFTIFYAFITLAIFSEVIQSRKVTPDTIMGTVCVYLLVGITFGSLYDLIETLNPGSFHSDLHEYLGFRQLLYYSFMTLTTVGYGEITPATSQTQSLASIEGVMGVLYVAVLIARIVGIYSSQKTSD